MKIKSLTNKDADWPNVLDNISPKVSRLYLSGRLHEGPNVGVIGTRRPTVYGIAATQKIVEPLARLGVGIVSGMAIGIDSESHKAALRVGGHTTAVLPSSIEKPYPSRHRNLAQQIAATGGIVSEYPKDIEVHKSNFIARNRIIAALSDLLIVVEATERSGTMHTVNFSIEMGKEVAAIPGPIDSLYSKGTNRIIRDGAHVITHADDVLSVLGLSLTPTLELNLNQSEQNIYECINTGTKDLAGICKKLKMDDNQIRQHLTNLELKNVVARRNDGLYDLR